MAPGTVGARSSGLGAAQDEDGSEGERVVGDEEECQGLDYFSELLSQHNKKHGNEDAGGERYGGRAAFVDGGGALGEEAVAAHGEEDARGHHVAGVHATEHGDDHDGANDRVAVAAENEVGGGAGGEF